MGLNPKQSSKPGKTSNLVGLMHFRATPRKADVVTWGYDMNTSSGVRDYCATGLLFFLLVLCAITVSGLTNSMQLVYFRADLCKARDVTLADNMALMRNITNYYESRQATSTTVNVTATAYFLAESAYNSLNASFTWPSPYDLSEKERQALELEAREGGDDCEPVKDCVGGIVGWLGGIVGQDTCVTAHVPCPNIEYTELLLEYDASQKSLDLFGNNVTTEDQFNSTMVAQTALDKATEAITVLVRRINFASSIYVLYLAFLVVVTPPFIVYGAKWNQRVFDFLANVNKPLWITFIVLIWYAHELFQSIINSSLYSIIWDNFLKDPCWADPEFLVNTSTVISETCTDITSSRNLFNQASANYRYYGQVESTWQAVPDAGGPFYGNAEEDLLQSFPGNCSAMVLLNAIQPGDGKVNWWTLFFHSGALVALLLQIVLANWFIAWFSVLRPLTMHRGRVMIPETSQNDEVLYREVRSFARARAIAPFALYTALLVFLLVNLGVSSSERGMWKKVLIASLCLVFLQFVLVPAFIWRPADEKMPKKMLSQEQQQQQQHQSSEESDSDDRSSGVFDSPQANVFDSPSPPTHTNSNNSSSNNNNNSNSNNDHDKNASLENGRARHAQMDPLSPLCVYDSPDETWRATKPPVNRGSSWQDSVRNLGLLKRGSSRKMSERLGSDESLSSVLQAALAATAAAAVVGASEPREPMSP